MLQLTSEQTDLLIKWISELTEILNNYHVSQGKNSTYADVKNKYIHIMRLIQLGIIPEN